ncbi:pirin family protein [Segetibacter koreensis]|uniref:pirin family protein n=1 Tax=Segetibacter koreensis TaxID=398037 RepID=UPI0003612801|nr:pirin family protein [Segetibacter koreensis]
MEKVIHRAAGRGTKDLGWLLSKFSFSFSNYQNPVMKGFGTLRVFNDDTVQKGGGFGIHAHVNMEIISVMLQGKMNHKDTLGYTEVVEKDWVQIMSAGSGLRHEEYNIGDKEVKFLQIWIEPKLQNISPRYQKRLFNKEKRKNTLQTIVSSEEGAEHCWINQNATLSLGWFEQGQVYTYSFNATNKCIYIFVLEGSVAIDGETLTKRDAIGIWGTNSFEIKAEQESEFIVIETPVNQ